MAFGCEYRLIETHVILTMTPMVVVIIHHVTKKPMKMLETTVVRPVGRAQTQVPFAHNRRVVTGGPQRAGEQGDTF